MGGQSDRRGLTGSARLLEDITKLDQQAFLTDRRKLQLSKTISLAAHDPLGFEQFRETGVLPFAATLEEFDHDFPGHYLRLIKRVRTSVIALIPPTEGIKATLATNGISRVVVRREGDAFEERSIHREPELVALSAALDASGVFNLQEEPQMLLPFEGSGLAAAWEFRLPRGSNRFDFGTIADVLVTIEYTALDSPQYREEVVQRLSCRLSAQRSFSFRNQFTDAWYDLHNPELVEESRRMVVRVRTGREDFAPNLDQVQIEHVMLYFARTERMDEEVVVTDLSYAEIGGQGPVGGGATTSGGLVSTRDSSGAGWMGVNGLSPVGEWELKLPNTERTRKWFKEGKIEDILLVVSYGGYIPEWPI